MTLILSMKRFKIKMFSFSYFEIEALVLHHCHFTYMVARLRDLDNNVPRTLTFIDSIDEF
jgi:ferritin-like protein